MVRATKVQFQIESYQRLKKCYSMTPCLTLCIIRYATRIRRINPRKGVVSSPTPRFSSYWKGSLRVALDYGRLTYLLYIYMYIYAYINTYLIKHHRDRLSTHLAPSRHLSVVAIEKGAFVSPSTTIGCLHIFVFILSSRRIDFMVSGGNWLMNFLWLIGSLVLSIRSWAIIRGVYIVKVMWPSHVHYYFVNIENLLFILVCCRFIFKFGSINSSRS